MLRRTILKRFAKGTLPLFFATGTVVTNAQEREVDLEEVVVTGFRKSLETAVDAKRNAQNVTDNIFAEDIGKSTDQNIAEALSRVTGVAINREDGEGSTISIRGAGPGLNNISLNGIQLTGFELDNNNVDLSAYSSDILSRVEIHKTSSADHDEGSLGGTVILHTFKPLDAKVDKRSLEMQYRTNDLAEESDYKVGGAFSSKFLDDTLGVAVTLYNETSTVRKDQFETDGTEVRTFPANTVRDQNGTLISDISADANISGIAYDGARYQSFFNERDRIGGSLGIQFAPTDETDIQFDLTHSTQTVNSDDNTAFLLGPKDVPGAPTILADYTKRFNGDAVAAQALVDNPPSDNDDPSRNWRVFDTDKGIFTKILDRYGDGRTQRNTSVIDNINTIASLELEHTVGALTFNLKAGHAESEAKDDYFADVNANSFLTVTPQMLYGVSSADIQPVGYDCTSGKCRIIAGTDVLKSTDDDLRTTFNNTRNTGFNPDDAAARHLQQLGIRDRTITDTADSLFADVDWEVDFGGFNLIEAGFKFASREKDVADTRSQFNGINSVNDPDVRLNLPGRGIEEVFTPTVNGGNFEFSNFLGGLGYPADNLTNGWPAIDTRKVIDLAFADVIRDIKDPDGKVIGVERVDPYTGIRPDLGDTRNITVDSSSIYVKGNFNFDSIALSGDIGVRYVKTENESSGFSTINYALTSGRAIQDLALKAVVENKDLPVCKANKAFAVKWGIVADDAAYDALNDTQRKALKWIPTPPAGQEDIGNDPKFVHQEARDAEARATPCFDPVLRDNEGTEDWRYKAQDITTPENQQFAVVGAGDNDVFLPSLNLNWGITDDLTGRLAASKTMARPNMDSLQPGFSLSENIWSSTATGNIRDPNLLPLESTNLDLALEWYFNDNGGLLSAAYFHKEFENFEDSESVAVALLDVRGKTNEDLNGSAAEDFILADTEASNCFPNRQHMWKKLDEPQNSPDLCKPLQVDKIINGKGATVDGIEVAYQQNYDMLPGIFGGLGIAMNATFQKTEADKQKVSIKDVEQFLPQFPLSRSPEKSFNSTVFWEQNGHLIRLAYNWSSDVLIQRSFDAGLALWEEGTGSLDLSATWAVNDWLSVNFNAVNLTDRETTQYFTSVTNPNINGALGLDSANGGEGSALKGDVDRGRIRRTFNTGRIFRLGLRASF